MTAVPVSIFQGQISDSNVDYRDSLPVNMYHIPKQIGNSNGYLRSQWGLEKFADGAGVDQGGIWSSVFKSHFRVSARSFIEISSLGTVTNIGEIDYSGQCVFNQTERNISITTDAGCWLYNPAFGLRKIDDTDLGAVFDTVYINQRLIHTDGEFIIVSNPGEDEVYDTLKYGTAEIDPDGIVALATISNRLLAIGTDTIEWFADQPTSGDTFPYVRIESQLIEVGAVGTHAKVQMTDENGFRSVYFLGGGKNDPVAVRSVGAGNAPKISTKEIDQILQSYSDVQLEKAVLENRMIEANNFVIVHLENHTLMIDLSATKVLGSYVWTIQKTDIVGDKPARWINGIFDKRIGAFIYGDRIGGNIGILKKEINTQYGAVVEELFYTPLIPFNKSTVLEMIIETLPGRNVPNTNPVLFISSTTNGLTYSPEYLAPLGSQADYDYDFVIRMRDFFSRPTAYKFRSASGQPINVSGLTLEVV